jgi:iron complex outermembrane receptor protein
VNNGSFVAKLQPMFRLSVLCAILFMARGIAAQSPSHISGYVANDQGQPLPGATVMLKQGSDSLLVKALLTDTAGSFRFSPVKPGNYLVQVSFLTYQSAWKTATAPGAPPLHFRLAPVTSQLQSVTVRGKRPNIQIDPARITVNVEQSITAQSQSAFELLRDVPGVTVNRDGEISIRGKKGVTVMMDGEPVEMSAAQLKNLLKATPGTTIQSIQILTNPPANVEAEGTAGVIDIRFKQKKRKGFSGSLSSGIGWGQYIKTDHSLYMNYGTGKWNFSGNYAFSHDRSWWMDSLHRVQSQHGRQLTMEQLQFMPERISSHMAKLGIDHYLDEWNTVSLQLGLDQNTDRYNGNSYTRFRSLKELPDSVMQQYNQSYNKQTNFTGGLKYKYLLNEQRSFIASAHTAQLRFPYGDEFRLRTFLPGGQLPHPETRYRNRYPVDMQVYSLKADYTEELRFGKETTGKLEAGLKSEFSKLNSRQQAADMIDGKWVDNPVNSNRFRFRENVHALYAMATFNRRRWELHAGLRAEHTYNKGDTLSGPALVRQQYWSLFPDIRIGYKVSDDYKLSVSYNRRIERPDYQLLNPTIRYVDPYNIEVGNPYLRPAFSNNLELSHQFFDVVLLTMGYTRMSNAMISAVLSDSSSLVARNTTVNAHRQDIWSASLSFPIPLADWWENYNSLYFTSTRNNTLLQGEEFHEHANTFGLSSNNSFKLPANFSFELNGWYEGGGLYGNMRYKPMAEVSLGLSKRFFDDKLNTAFSLSDLFYTTRYRSTVTSAGEHYYINARWESRVAKFTVTWNFGKKIPVKEEKHDEGMDRLPSGKSGRKGKF